MFAGNGMLLPKTRDGHPRGVQQGLPQRPGTVGGAVHHHRDRPDRAANHVDAQPQVVGHHTAAGQHHLLWCSTTPRASPRCRTTRIDATGLASLDELTIARQHRRHRDPACARASAGTTSPSTARPARSSPTRRCAWPIAKGIDRQTIANVTQRGLVDNPAPLNNHIYVAGQEGYQDNSAVVAFDPEAAKRELDALGWKMNGQFREKDGKQLVIRDVLYDAQSTRQFGSDRAEQPGPDRRQARTSTPRPATASSASTSPSATSTSPSSPGSATLSRCPGSPRSTCRPGRATSARSAAPEIDAKIEQTLEELDAGQGPRPGQRTRQADLGRGLQPAADPVARKRGRAKQSRELRRRRAG